MVTERADAPEPGGDADPVEQGLFDLTPQGQDAPDTGAVDAAPVEGTPPPAPTAEAVGTLAPTAPPTPGQPQAEPDKADPQSFGEMRDQVRAQQEQLQYYGQLEQRARLQQAADQYSQQLQQQGYLPEQAQQAAQSQLAQAQQVQQLDQQAEQYRQFKEGQRNAAVHFAKEHKLGIDDLATLERFNTPAEMEIEAKRMSQTRGMAAELAQLKQQQVPAQSFDNNQPSPSATGSENDLLDKYIAGDRSPDAVAAAARLLG